MADLGYVYSLYLAQWLTQNKKKLTIAESCTGGGLGYELTAVEGASIWFERGFVTYSNEAKQELLTVPSQTIQQFGSVSSETALAMAEGALQNSHADIALSVTGIAGPGGGTKEKPVGTVWFGIADRAGFKETKREYFTSGRRHIRQETIEFALHWLVSHYVKLSL